MKKLIKTTKICIISTFSLMLTACSCNIPGVTVPMDYKETETIKQTSNENDLKDKENNVETKKVTEITDNIDETRYEIRSIPKDKTIYNIGDVVSPISKNSLLDTGVYVHFKVKSAKIYEKVKDANIDESKISDKWELFDSVCGYDILAEKNEETMNSRFLLCDMDFEYVQSYIDWLDFDTVTRYALIYVQDDGRYVMTGFPIYFSEKGEYQSAYRKNAFSVKDGKVNMQIGWVVDKDIFNVEEFDVSKLYICTAHDGMEKNQEFVYLGLKE